MLKDYMFFVDDFRVRLKALQALGDVRPSSYDELGAKSARSRIESMINLGVGSGKASGSDPMFRDPLHDSAVRMRLVVREDGKHATHFVSFFSNLSQP